MEDFKERMKNMKQEIEELQNDKSWKDPIYADMQYDGMDCIDEDLYEDLPQDYLD